MFVSRALDPELLVFHFDVIRQCGGLPATGSVFADTTAHSPGYPMPYLPVFFLGFPTAFVGVFALFVFHCFCCFCWRGIRQARHGRRGLRPAGSHTAIRCIYSKRSRSIAIHLRFRFAKDSAWLTKAVCALSCSQREQNVFIFHFT